MRKRKTTASNFLKIGLSLFLFINVCVGSYGQQTLQVGEDITYSTIQEAVNAATTGDTIVIHSGTYREVVRIAVDGITITANEGDTVIINGTEPILEWELVGEGVYKAFMDWNINEGDQTDQIFVDGKMMHLTRWPDQTNEEFVMDPFEATMEDVIKINDNLAQIVDDEFELENADRWDGASIFVNLSNPICKRDGQGWTGTANIVDGKIRTRAGGSGRYETCGNWHIGEGTRYYLFNPKPAAVEATGGVTALLSSGEWWKNGDTLFLKTPDGTAPASTLTGKNLVEAKKYPFAFRPESGSTFSNVTIKDLKLFATSITTLDNYFNYYQVAPAENNLFDNLDVRYVTHSNDNSGNWQVQYNGRSGIILSGTNNILMNSTIEYSNASAVSIMGKANRLLNCKIFNVNYSVSESGAVNFGQRNAITVDHQIAYNTIYNTAHAGISMREINEIGDEVTPGQARIHHNVLHDCLARAYDAGVMDGSRSKNGMRIDHNIIYNSPEFLQIGIYLDFGDFIDGIDHHPGELIVDHNVIYNVHNAIQPNASSYVQVYNNTILHSSGGFAIGGVHLEDVGMKIRNNFGVPAFFGKDAVTTNNLNTSSYLTTYFTDPDNGDFTLTENAILAIDSAVNVEPFNGRLVGPPDIGAYEYGVPPWSAGASDESLTFYQLTIQEENGNVQPPSGLYRAGDTIPVEAGDILGYVFDHWSGDVTGTSDYIEIVMDSSINLTANYLETPVYTLTLNAENGKVDILPKQAEYNKGSLVELLATPDENYNFIGWTGDTVTSSNPITIIMNDNKDITANFEIKPTYTITTSATNGSIILTPSETEYFEGARVYVAAIPDEGFEFRGWTSNYPMIDSLSRQFVTVNEDLDITANFTQTSIDARHAIGGINIFPVPVGDDEVLHVILKGKVMDHIDIKIYDMAGKRCYANRFYHQNIEIPLSQVNSIQQGVHVLKVFHGNRTYHTKLLIK